MFTSLYDFQSMIHDPPFINHSHNFALYEPPLWGGWGQQKIGPPRGGPVPYPPPLVLGPYGDGKRGARE